MENNENGPDRMLEALRQFGLNESLMGDLNPRSQIVTDLGIWGDAWDDFYEILSRVYDTDHLIPAEWVPSEFAWARSLKGWLPFTDLKDAVPSASLSVAELDQVMCGLGLHTKGCD